MLHYHSQVLYYQTREIVIFRYLTDRRVRERGFRGGSSQTRPPSGGPRCHGSEYLTPENKFEPGLERERRRSYISAAGSRSAGRPRRSCAVARGR